jgi:hypothetical protein
MQNFSPSWFSGFLSRETSPKLILSFSSSLPLGQALVTLCFCYLKTVALRKNICISYLDAGLGSTQLVLRIVERKEKCRTLILFTNVYTIP